MHRYGVVIPGCSANASVVINQAKDRLGVPGSVLLFFIGLLCMLLPATGVADNTAKVPLGQYDFTDSKFQRGLLWRISREGKQRGFVFGTVHSSDPRVLEIAPDLYPYIAQVEAVCPELELNIEDSMLLSRAIIYDDETTLIDVVGPALFESIADLLLKVNIPRVFAIKLKPWAVIMMLSIPKQDTATVLDLVLLQHARTEGKSIQPLEKMAEQIAAFENASLDDQISLLKDTMDQHPDLEEYFDRMITGYLQQDLLIADQLMDEQVSNDVQVVDRFMDRLVAQRNITMTTRAEDILKSRSCFIAIGMLHLPGSKGVLHLLEQRGWQIESVDEFKTDE